VQLPVAQTPEQHRLLPPHGLPVVAHWHLPPPQLPVQQSLPFAQLSPVAMHAQCPDTQLPEQHSPSPPHSTPPVEHAHLPLVPSHTPEQQNALLLQTEPVVAQLHAPVVQIPEQHSAPVLQAPVRVAHAQPPDELPEQHTDAPDPGSPQHTPLPPQTRVASHSPLSTHPLPAAESQV
jgi:hypothetical protein